MNFSRPPGSGLDVELQNFIEKETQRTRFKLLVSNLTDKCWDVCMNKLSTHLESKTESCITNCVERFMDASSFIINRLGETRDNRSSMNFE